MFMVKLARKTTWMGGLIAMLCLTSTPQASAAQNIYYSSLGSSGCVNALASNSVYASKLIAVNAVTINTINVIIGTGSQTGFSASRYYIMANNPTGGSSSNGAPSTVLATFTPDSISGSGVNTVAKFIGTYTVAAGTKYWIAASQSLINFPACYWYPSSATVLNQNSFVVDTSTSGNNNNWLRAYVTNGTNPVGANWFVAIPDGLVFQYSLEYNTSAPVVATLTTQSGSLKTDFRTVTPLTVSVDTQSKVTFYANGKVIAGCRSILSSAGTATCNWRPSVHGAYRITASANPISTSYIASNSGTININVSARTGTR
jgi:hypothetical protein